MQFLFQYPKTDNKYETVRETPKKLVTGGHKHTNSFPSKLNNSSVAGHSGLFTVVRRSCTKFSNKGLQSISSVLLPHLFKNTERKLAAVLYAVSYLLIIRTSRSTWKREEKYQHTMVPYRSTWQREEKYQHIMVRYRSTWQREEKYQHIMVPYRSTWQREEKYQHIMVPYRSTWQREGKYQHIMVPYRSTWQRGRKISAYNGTLQINLAEGKKNIST